MIRVLENHRAALFLRVDDQCNHGDIHACFGTNISHLFTRAHTYKQALTCTQIHTHIQLTLQTASL